MGGWKFVVNRGKGELVKNQIGFCKWKCFTDLEVDFLQVFLVTS